MSVRLLIRCAASIACGAFAACATTAVAIGAASVVFVGPAQPTWKLKSPRTIVYGADGQMLFVADEEFARKIGGGQKVLEWNPAKSLVRIGAEKARTYWLACEALEPMAIACSNLELSPGLSGEVRVAQKPTHGKYQGSERGWGSGTTFVPSTARGLPNCPGDPRCPKLGG